jgi:translation initiation factor IF-1
MKSFVLFFVLLFSFIGFAQDNHIVKTEDGRRVLLKADFTWEYIDVKTSNSDSIATTISKSKAVTECHLPDDYVEPPLNKKIQAQLKKGRATISHVKQKVAKKYKCNVDDVVLLSVSEQKAKAEYKFCVKGKEVAYKRIGTTIIKKEKLF